MARMMLLAISFILSLTVESRNILTKNFKHPKVTVTVDQSIKENFNLRHCGPIKKNVTMTRVGCIPMKIELNFCGGFCNSMVLPIPNSLKKCNSCQVTRFEMKAFTLPSCHSKTKTRVVHMQNILECRCKHISCNGTT